VGAPYAHASPPPQAVKQQQQHAPPPGAVNQQQLARLQVFYQKYQPDKVPEAHQRLEQYAGREDLLFRMLVQKYGPEPQQHAPATDHAAAYRHDMV
jgi:hypothetical protein